MHDLIPGSGLHCCDGGVSLFGSTLARRVQKLVETACGEVAIGSVDVAQ